MMGDSSSNNAYTHPQSQYYEDDDFSEAGMARRAEKIRKRLPADDAISPEYTAFISPDSLPFVTRLPREIVEDVVSQLDNRSIKSLRLTCRFFSVIRLRINRVFLSANPLNVQVFRSIADHDSYRLGIAEIIYDDARLCRSSADHWHDIHVDTHRWLEMPTDMEWFHSERDKNLYELQNRQNIGELDRPETTRQINAELSLEESWIYYQDLLRQQDEVVASGADVEALRYGLRRFPALLRVTVTPSVHGWLFPPLYETPMIRAFPHGFNYPIPRGWPTRRAGEVSTFAAPWRDTKERWRGCNIVAEVLAQEQQHHRVSEFLIDSHYLNSGLNCLIFEEPSQEYLNLLSILRQSNLKKFHLSLYVDGQSQEGPNWSSFRTNLLRNALAEASQLEQFSMATSWNEYVYNEEEPPLALRKFLPVDCWTGLQHFGLWKFPVHPADLISTLSQLPGLQSLELGLLTIYRGSDFELLNDMRNSLCWHERLERPKVKYAIPIPGKNIQGRAIWLDEEVENFLYRDGENPFDAENDQVGYWVGIIRDAYDPAYERSQVFPFKYQNVGISKQLYPLLEPR